MILKAILCVQRFCSFGLMSFIVILFIKTDFAVICVPCMLEHVCCGPFSLKITDSEDIFVNWLNFVYCLKFTSLRPNLSK